MQVKFIFQRIHYRITISLGPFQAFMMGVGEKEGVLLILPNKNL